MTSPSPSEFLTFMRHIIVRSSLCPSTISPIQRCPYALPTYRALSTTAPRNAYSDPTKGNPKTAQDRQQATERKDRLDIQSDAAHGGHEEKAKGSGGSATEQRDLRNSQKRAKDEHPEAPVTIGMQDERGGRGH